MIGLFGQTVNFRSIILFDHPVCTLSGPKQVTICYLLVNISYLTVMSPSEMAISDAVAVVRTRR